VPYTAIHGTADKVVPYLGGGESVLSEGDSDPSLRVFFEQVMPSEFGEFAADASCDPATTDTAVGEDVIRHEYTACEGGVPMVFEEVQGGGHTWPSSPLASHTEGGSATRPTTTTPHATAGPS
jgi:poly(3-hydroxybutyrate) depolymerase